MENLTGKHIDRYQILEPLGKGGMAMVYKAYDPRLEREVAIKIISSDAFPPAELQEVLRRFEREAKALARLSHPNIVKVLDYGEYEGSPFLVLEYLPGGTLKHQMGEPMPWQEAMRLLLPVAKGMEYAHFHGIVHRDIKPANILLTENGEPTLSDFGIVKLLQGEKAASLTASGTAVGTPEYMAPEQWTGEASTKSDMYSLGVVLYEIITGRRPYVADTPGGMFLKQVTEPLPLPRNIIPGLPEPVERFLLKTLDKEPSKRFENLEVFVRELESLLNRYNFQSQSAEIEADKSVKDAMVDVEKVPPHPGTEVPAPSTAMSFRPNRRWIGIVVIGAGMVVVTGAVMIVALILGIPKIQGVLSASPASTKADVENQPPPSIVTPAATPASLQKGVTDEMVLVPNGEFVMGNAYGGVDEQPEHAVYLDSYFIDKYEVTNASYQACVDAGACARPTDTRSATRSFYYGNPAFDNYPVIFVDWDMAKTYCVWRGADLPTEAQWEKAARSVGGRLFPWGDLVDITNANYNNSVGDTTEVGSYRTGVSPYGAYDMAGNVWEWVADWYSEYFYQDSPASNPLGPASGEYRVMRGGSFINGPETEHTGRAGVESTIRAYIGNGTVNVDYVGFRCAKDAAP